MSMCQIKRGLTIFAFLLLSIMVLTLFGFTVYEAWMAHWLGGVLSSIILVGVGVGVFLEGKAVFSASTIVDPLRQSALEVLAVLIGGLAAYTLAHDVGLGPVVAASLVGIVAHLVVPKFSTAAYAGAFVGMTSDLLLLTHLEVLLASLFSGVVFYLTKPVFPGVGGKLGTIALIGTTMMSLSLQRIFLIAPLPDFQTSLEIIVIALIATPLTFYLSAAHGNGPVLASGVVGMISGLVLHVIYPEMGTNLAVVAICASFAGMSGRERLPNFGMVLLVALLTGVVFIFSTPHLGGAGGKLGTIAFGSVLAVIGFRWVLGGNGKMTGNM
ncbi:MAG: hypothetical protein H0S82_05260 [Anaerolineaceae bacterium]|nr:hypothetical protein [Anaerolineaceae bacterium]